MLPFHHKTSSNLKFFDYKIIFPHIKFTYGYNQERIKVKLLNTVFFMLFLQFLIITNLYSNEQKEIVWLQHQRPPWMISSGIHKNQGYGDKIRKVIESKLPDYKHKLLPINPSRLLKELKNNNTVCYGPVGKFPILKDKFYWSKALYLLTGYRIITLEHINQKYNRVKTVSMKKLLEDKSLIFGQIANMWHYPIEIKDYEHQNNILSISSSAPLSNLLSMMQKKRVDWVFDHPVFVKWANTVVNSNPNEKFITMKVKESSNSPKIIAYIGCTKNIFGKTIIDKINDKHSKEDILLFRNYVRKWQLNEETLNSFESLNRNFFGF